MKWLLALYPLLLGGCAAHQPDAECQRYLAGMKQVFDSYDRNRDGWIDLQEYDAAIEGVAQTAMDPQTSNETKAMTAPFRMAKDFHNLDRNHRKNVV